MLYSERQLKEVHYAHTVPNVLDRLIQQAICQVLTPIFDPTFSESSFGFRPGRSAHGATKRVQQIIRQGHSHCVDVDLSKFFDRVQHDVLMAILSRKVHDLRLLRLIGRYLRAGVMVEGVLQPTPEGSPQGGPLSPLLSNILLDELDKELERRGLQFVRYADDFMIFVCSERSAQRVFASVQRFLTRRLKLVVNEQKSSVRSALGCEFLGFTFVGKRATIKSPTGGTVTRVGTDDDPIVRIKSESTGNVVIKAAYSNINYKDAILHPTSSRGKADTITF